MSIVIKFILAAATLMSFGIFIYFQNVKSSVSNILVDESSSPAVNTEEAAQPPDGKTYADKEEPVPPKQVKTVLTPENTDSTVVVPMPVSVPPILPPLSITIEIPATSTVNNTVATSTSAVKSEIAASLPLLPPLDEEALLRAVVKIQCPAKDNKGLYIGSGFVVSTTTVVTAAHVIMNSATTTCDVIFPSERKPIHYLRGVTENLVEIKKRHDENGIDVATLTLPPIDSYPEARAIFESYPAIPYPICGDPSQIDDALLHFGYPSNYKDQSYLSELEGKVVVFADIAGIEDQSSLDQTSVYKTPIFSYTDDESQVHPYIVSRVPSFYGDSGGMAFNKTKQCVLGPHRGGTIGKASGENYTIFMNLGWNDAKEILPRP